MLESKIRPLYQKICVDGLLTYLPKRIKPIHITVLAGFFGILSSIFIVIDEPWVAVFLLLLSGYCDTLDGSLSRYRGVSSEVGSLCDIVCDRIVEFSILLGLFLKYPQFGVYTFIMLGAVFFCVTTFLVIGIFVDAEVEKSFFYHPGVIERAEAFLFFIAMILFSQFFIPLSLIFTALVVLTGCLHLFSFLRYIKNQSEV